MIAKVGKRGDEGHFLLKQTSIFLYHIIQITNKYTLMMVTIERIFTGLFNNKNITTERLVKYGEDQVSKTETNNPAGIYTVIINETKAKIDNVQGNLDNAQISHATGKGGTVEKNETRKECEAFVSNGEGLIKYHFNEGSPIYIEFFPNGLSNFTNASDTEFVTLMNAFVTTAKKYDVKLGVAFGNDADTKTKAFINSAKDHTQDNSNISTARSNEKVAHAELAMQLTKNVLTIALNNLGNVDVVKTYFNLSLLYGAYHQQTFNLTLKSNEVQTPIDKQFAADAEITVTANQTVEVSLSNNKDVMQKNFMTIMPNEPTTIKLSEFNDDLATHHFIVIKNNSAADATVKVEL